MDEMLKVWAMTFDRSPQPFGIVEVLVDDSGRPYDAAYRYLNPAMAAHGCAHVPHVGRRPHVARSLLRGSL